MANSETTKDIELRRSEDRFRTTVDCALDCIIAIDEQGDILEFNPAAETCFGFSRDAVVGKEMAGLIVPEKHRNAHRQGMDHFLKTGEGPVIGTRIEIEAQRANGEIFPVELAIETAVGAEGKIFIAYMRDITERKNSEERLENALRRAEQASEAKTGFLAMMSHEIRTPLNGVLGVLGLLEDTDPTDEQKNYISTARESGHALLEIISDILDFSKMEAGRLNLEASDFHIKSVIQSAIGLLAPTAQNKGISLNLEVADDVPPYVTGDSGRIRQILLNLISNAIKFSKDSDVDINVENKGTNGNKTLLRFSVEDSGIGIAKDIHDKIFGEFTTVDPSFARRFGGTGLGLAISKRLVDMMGGEIDFESVQYSGSKFWFTLELARAEKPADIDIEESPAIAEMANLPKLRVLVAEDNSTNALVTRAILLNAGHNVDLAANGIEALSAVRTRPYDIILMDVSMPEMDGLEATKIIRSLESDAANIPIVALTAHAMSGDRENFLNAGMSDYLSKPVSKKAILRVLRRHCGGTTETNHASENATTADHIPDRAIDETVLVQLAEETSIDLIPTLAHSFLDDLKIRTDNAISALASDDMETLEREAHTLCSSAATFGAQRLSDICREIDQALRTGDAARAREKTAGLTAASQEADKHMRIYLDNLKV